MAYGLGASIVIMGALFKILHWELGPLNGGILLAVGLITEAIIFAISLTYFVGQKRKHTTQKRIR